MFAPCVVRFRMDDIRSLRRTGKCISARTLFHTSYWYCKLYQDIIQDEAHLIMEVKLPVIKKNVAVSDKIRLQFKQYLDMMKDPTVEHTSVWSLRLNEKNVTQVIVMNWDKFDKFAKELLLVEIHAEFVLDGNDKDEDEVAAPPPTPPIPPIHKYHLRLRNPNKKKVVETEENFPKFGKQQGKCNMERDPDYQQ